MSLMLHGIGVADGIAIGRAYIMERGQPDIAEYTIPDYLIDAEIERYNSAVAAAREELIQARENIPETLPGEVTEFIDAHLLMLEDSALSRTPVKTIRHEKCNAEWALKQQRAALAQAFQEMDDEYLRTRKDDIDHVINRILRILLQQESDTQELIDPEEEEHAPRIIIAERLSPSDIILLHHQDISGVVTEHGTPNSHTAILLRSLHLPTVMGVAHVQRYLKEGESVVIDGKEGMVLATDEPTLLNRYLHLQTQAAHDENQLSKLRSETAITRDGTAIHLQANIDLPAESEEMEAVGITDVGLYRTEFLYLNRTDFPSEEEQFEQYRAVAERLPNGTLTIRTLDIGMDKTVAMLSNAVCSDNPALGLRSIRLSLRHTELLIPQIRAILRASAFGKIRMMLPMVSNLQEVRQVQAHIEQEKQNLQEASIEFDPDIQIGAMVETPAAALSADGLAQCSDFLSIGTNDLIQYTLAIDRADDQVNYLFDPFHPSVLRLIHQVIQAGQQAGKSVEMCGEMAGDERFTQILLGIGLRSFSMSPAVLPKVKRRIREVNLKQIEPIAQKIIASPFPEETLQLMSQLNSNAN